jgi:uncharacterized membrane protein YbhN (UPF0104 family)
MKKKSLITLVFYFLLLAALVYMLSTQDKLLDGIKGVSAFWLLAVLVFKVLVQIANGYRLNVLLFFENIRLPLVIWLPLSCVGTLQNAVLPGNMAVASKAVYLKHKFSLGYKKYLLLTLAGSVIFVFVNTVVLAVLNTYLINELMLLLYVLVAVSVLILVFMAVVRLYNNSRENKYVSYLDGISLLIFHADNLKIVFNAVASEVVLIVFRSLALWACFAAVGFQGDLIVMVVISVLVSFSGIINITPGNMGVTESVIIGIALIFSIPLEFAIAASILSRLSSVASQFLIVFVMGKKLI